MHPDYLTQLSLIFLSYPCQPPLPSNLFVTPLSFLFWEPMSLTGTILMAMDVELYWPEANELISGYTTEDDSPLPSIYQPII